MTVPSIMTAPVRLVLADPGTWLRGMIAGGLRDDGFDVVAEVSDRVAALEAVLGHDPDVAVLDVGLLPTRTNEGVLVAKDLRSEGWLGGLVLMSSGVTASTVADLLESCSGGVGFVDKNDVSTPGLADVIRRVDRGEPVVPASIVQLLMRRARPVNALDSLTPIQRRVWSLVAEGCSNTVMAERLGVDHRRVQTLVRDVFSIFGRDGFGNGELGGNS